MLSEQFLKRNLNIFPDKEAIIDGDKRITFLELYQRSNRLANALLNLGISKGSRIAFMEKNSHQTFEFYFAAAKIGAIAVLVNWRLREKELTFVINDCEAQTLVLGEEFQEVVISVRSELKNIKQLIIIGKKQEGGLCYEELLEKASDQAPHIAVDENDPLLQMYTSGTTGLPKGAVLTHRNAIINFLHCLFGARPHQNDIFLNCGIFFHMPFLFSLSFTMIGATNVIMRNYSPEETLKLIQKEKADWMLVVPTMLNMILNYPEKSSYDLKSLKSLVYGGMPITTASLKAALEFFRCDFYQFYGSTESGPVSFLPPEDHLVEGPANKTKRLQSAGICGVLTDLKVVDEQDREVGPGEVGEIMIKSASVMAGYWKRPEETEAVLKDGWYHIGDMARIEDGRIYLVDRKKDMIISGGENIYPVEIEEVISHHPAVKMVAVIGVPDQSWGESVKAIVVPKEGEKPTEEEIISFCKERLAGYKKPKTVDFVDSLPLNPVGKVLKKVLREKYWQGQDRRIH